MAENIGDETILDSDALLEQHELRVGDTLCNRFLLEEEIGRGGMGKVFKAYDKTEKLYVAIKVLGDAFKRHKNAREAMRKEAVRTRDLKHENIVNVYGFDEDEARGECFIRMEFLEGVPLSKKRPNHRQAIDYIEGIGKALQHAHAQRPPLIHADIKPGNVFVTDDGKVKVLDFGISRIASTEGESGEISGYTLEYASCEVLERNPPDPRDDVYALACVAFELLQGKKPFGDKGALRARNDGDVPKPVKGLRPKQWEALQKGLKFNRGERTESVEDFLHGILADGFHLKPGHVGALLLVVVLGTAALFAWNANQNRQARQEAHALLDQIEAFAASPTLPGLAQERVGEAQHLFENEVVRSDSSLRQRHDNVMTRLLTRSSHEADSQHTDVAVDFLDLARKLADTDALAAQADETFRHIKASIKPTQGPPIEPVKPAQRKSQPQSSVETANNGQPPQSYPSNSADQEQQLPNKPEAQPKTSKERLFERIARLDNKLSVGLEPNPVAKPNIALTLKIGIDRPTNLYVFYITPKGEGSVVFPNKTMPSSKVTKPWVMGKGTGQGGYLSSDGKGEYIVLAIADPQKAEFALGKTYSADRLQALIEQESGKDGVAMGYVKFKVGD